MKERLENQLPSLVTEGKDARMSARVPHMANPYEDLSAGFAAFGRGMGSIARDLAALAREGQALALNQAQAEYEKEVQAGLQEKVYNLSGASATGCADAAAKVLGDAERRQMDRLSIYGPKVVNAFRNYVLRGSAARMSHVSNYARGQMRTADLAMRKQKQALLVEQASAQAGGAFEDVVYGQLPDEVKRGWFYHNRGVLDADSLSADDLERMVAQLSPEEQADLDRQIKSVQPLAVAKRVDALLKDGLIDDAELVLEDHKGLLPEGAYESAKKQIGLLRENRDMRMTVSAMVDGLLAKNAQDPKTRADGGLTPATIEDMAKKQQELDEAARNDPTGRARKAADLFREECGRAVRLANQRQDAAYASALMELSKLPSVKDMTDWLARQPDSYLKDRLIEYVAKRSAAEEAAMKKTSWYKDNQTALKFYFVRRLAAGLPIKPPNYKEPAKLDSPEAIVAAMTDFGLDEASQDWVLSYMRNPRVQGIAAHQDVVAEVVNTLGGLDPKKGKRYYTADTLGLAAPELYEELDRIAKMFPDLNLKSSEGKKQLQEWARGILYRKAGKYTLIDVILKGLSPSGDVVADPDGGEIDTMAEFSRLALSPEQARDIETRKRMIRGFAVPREEGESDADMAATRRGRGIVQNSELDALYYRVGDDYYSDLDAAIKSQEAVAADLQAKVDSPYWPFGKERARKQLDEVRAKLDSWYRLRHTRKKRGGR